MVPSRYKLKYLSPVSSREDLVMKKPCIFAMVCVASKNVADGRLD